MKDIRSVENLKELRKKQVQLILIILAFLSILFISYTVYWEIDYNKKYGYFKSINAEVVDHNVIDELEYDVLEYDVGGITYLHTTSYISKNHIEDKITIYYDANNPNGVIYSLDSRRIVLPILSALFLLASIGVYVFYYFVFVRSVKMDDTKVINTNGDKVINNKKLSKKNKESKKK